MKYRILVNLVCGLILGTIGGCLDKQPTPDIEDIVEARIKERTAEQAVIEARAIVIAKAMIEATAQSAFTATLVLPTPTLTNTPIPTATFVLPTPISTNTPIPIATLVLPAPTLTNTPIPTATFVLPTPTLTNTPIPTTIPVPDKLSTAQLVDIVRPSVVRIVTELFGGDSGSGTGIVYSEDGLVLTNHHVVAGATRIMVLVTDVTGVEQVVSANLLGANADVDIAFLQLEIGSYVPVKFGSVKDVSLGDEVVALGYPLADETEGSLTVTRGIVSSIRNDGRRNVIQHQASINPGNSGGPLLNDEGLVVGMNTYILRNSLQGVPIEGFNMAVAIDEALSRMDQLGTIDFALNSAVTYLSNGVAYYLNGQYEQAIENYDEAIRLNPQYTTAYNNRGVSYHHLGKYERAIENYDEAIRLNSQYDKAYNNRGLAYHHLGKYERAVEDYNEAIRINFQYITAYFNRGIAYYYLGKYDWAIRDYDKVIDLDPGNEEIEYWVDLVKKYAN